MKDASGGGCSAMPGRRMCAVVWAQQNHCELLCTAPVMGTTILH